MPMLIINFKNPIKEQVLAILWFPFDFENLE